MSSEYQQLVREWSVRLMKRLYNERPRFCDVAIECIPTRREDGTDAPVQNTVYAHRAVLAARTLYFQQAFLGAAGYQDGATLQVSPHESLGPSDLGQLDTMPSAHYNGEHDGDTSAGMPAPTNEIVKGARVTFKESAHVLERIVEFMYLGEIAKLEEGNSNTTEDDYNLWMWLLTWSFKHRVQDLFHYMLSHLMNMKLTPAFAARLLDLQIESSFSMSASVNMEEERTGYNMMLDNIRGHAIEWFNKADFNEDIFLPLNRQALLVVLTECVFQVPEYQVVKAVKRWSTSSQWVAQAYSSAPMPRDQVHVIMQHTDPFCLTNLEFDELTHPPETSIYNRHTFAKYWDVMATHEGVRFNDSDRCLDRSVLVEKFRKPDSTGSQLTKPTASKPHSQPTSPAPRPHIGHTQSQDVIARPIPEVSMDPSVPLLTSIDEQARVDKGRPETAFVVGPNYFFKRDQSEFRYLVSLSVTTYQGLMYRGGIKNGKLKWSLDIVRQCDMFWMGVTANSGLDMSTMIARNQQVWMISEEGTCIEHCRNNAVTQAQPVRQRMNTLFIDCFKCVKNLPPSWKKVVMELDSGTGDLYVTLNDKEREHVFKNLPTHTRLFPCLMAVNTGQAHFELLDARMH